MKSENLAKGLWYAVLWISVLFYAFALGVWAAEQEEPKEGTAEPVVVSRVDGPMMAERTETETAPEVTPMLCENTYLREDIPLDFDQQAALYGACLEFEVPYELALAVIEQETEFRNVSGDSGRAEGYFQIWPSWWGELMAEIGAEDLSDYRDNFRTGCAILARLLERYDTADALTAYNSGKPGESDYSRSVLERMGKYEMQP